MKHSRKINSTCYDDSQGENGKYLPSYPLIWTPSREIESNWTKLYDVLVTDYCEEYGFLNIQELGFYSFNLTYARIKKGILIKPFSKKYKISDNSLVAMIDKFQDLELADRVCRTDHRGYPIDIVLRPPKSPRELRNGEAARLQTNLGKTAFLRKELGRDFPTQRFSEKTVTTALGRQKAYLADKFHNLCILENYRVLVKQPNLKVNSKEFKDKFLPAIHRFCQRHDIEYDNDSIVTAALNIAENYGRKPTNLDKELEKVAQGNLKLN